MNRQELLHAIKTYKPYNKQEERDQVLIANWIEEHEDAFFARESGGTCDSISLGCQQRPKQGSDGIPQYL